jgi:hypothetical protein
MPRMSAEARSAAAFRSGIKRRDPPARLEGAERSLWREILADRPVDFFRPGSFELLEQYVIVTVRLRDLLARLRSAGPKEIGPVTLSIGRLSTVSSTLARLLRLTNQADIDQHSRAISEKGDGKRDRLLGGAALRAIG